GPDRQALRPVQGAGAADRARSHVEAAAGRAGRAAARLRQLRITQGEAEKIPRTRTAALTPPGRSRQARHRQQPPAGTWRPWRWGVSAATQETRLRRVGRLRASRG